MVPSGLLLAFGGAGMVLAAVAIRGRGKPAVESSSYSRTAYALTPLQLVLGVAAVLGGLVIVGR